MPAAVFFDFLRRRAGHAPIGHCSGGDEHAGLLDTGHDSLRHLLGRAHIHTAHTAGGGQAHRPGHQCDLGASLVRSPGHGKTHFAAGQIGDAAHRVNGFVGRPGGDQHALAGQGLGCKKSDQVFKELFRLEHAAVTCFAAGLKATAHAQHHGTVSLQLRQVALGGRVRVHLAVHGRGQQQGHRVDGAG